LHIGAVTIRPINNLLLCTCIAAAGDEADPLRVYGVARSLELCEADNEVLRLQEELPLLRREMQAHLKYWQQYISRQQQVERVLLDVSGKVNDAVAAGLFNEERVAEYAVLLEQSLQAIEGGISLPSHEQQHGRYQASAAQLLTWPGAMSGALNAVRTVQEEGKGHLARAVAAFAPFISTPQAGSSSGGAAAGAAAAAAPAPDSSAAFDAGWDDVGSSSGGAAAAGDAAGDAAGAAAGTAASAAAAAAPAPDSSAAFDAGCDDVGSEDEAWVPSDVGVDEEEAGSGEEDI
jgi:hypothetical protein